MSKRPLGTTLLSGTFLVAGVTAIGVSWAAWPRSPSTSPLLALCALAFGGAYIVAGVLTWRGSRHAPAAFVGAIGLLLFPARMIVPGGELLAPAFVVLALIAVLGHRYLHKAHQATA